MARRRIVNASAGDHAVTLADYRETPLRDVLAADACVIGHTDAGAATGDAAHPLVFAGYRLQDIGDYRRALQGWFRLLAPGGRLVVTVPHAFLYERQTMLPSRWHAGQKRLYTPSSLAAEIEEALEPNSYRLRWLGDVDTGYDYALDRETVPVGRHDVAAVIERVALPGWGLEERDPHVASAPPYAFVPERTRIEHGSTRPHHRILALKLDHLGDFVMGLPALRRLRDAFPSSEITLVVGPWNESLARSSGLADHVVAFAAYPRNSSEEEVDVPGKKALFDALITERYDLAIDLRTDPDTRFFLRDVRTPLRAGMGTRREFPYLDIFLPADITRHGHEAAWEDDIPLHHFSSQGYCRRTHYQIACHGAMVQPDRGAIVWGPYRHLDPGDYIFQPFLEVEHRTPGLLAYDVALDAERVAAGTLAEPRDVSLGFRVAKRASFEFRFQAVGDEAVPDFRFYGGRLVRQAASGVLHQSEYLRLLIELVALRVREPGSLVEGVADA